MGKMIDLLGRRFNKLLVVGYAGINKYGRADWECKCDCGNMVVVGGNSLTTCNTSSCGCFKIENTKRVNTRHGGRVGYKNTPEFEAWVNMRRRCYEKSNPMYKHYGGRGIIVCERWRNSFSNFLKDIGERPSKKHSLDRFPNNDGNYEPNNCRWATDAQQRRNKRVNIYLEYNNERMVMADWAKKINISTSTLFGRLKRKWPLEKALSIPALTNGERII